MTDEKVEPTREVVRRITVRFNLAYRNQPIWVKALMSHFDPECPPTIVESKNIFWPEAKFSTTFLRACKFSIIEKELVLDLHLSFTPLKTVKRYESQTLTIISKLPRCNMCHTLEHTRFRCPRYNCMLCNSPEHNGPQCLKKNQRKKKAHSNRRNEANAQELGVR